MPCFSISSHQKQSAMAKKKALKPTHFYSNTKMPVTFITLKHNVDYRTIVTTIMYMLEFDREDEITADIVTEKIHHLFYWRGSDFFDHNEVDAAFLDRAEQLANKLFPSFFKQQNQQNNAK